MGTRRKPPAREIIGFTGQNHVVQTYAPLPGPPVFTVTFWMKVDPAAVKRTGQERMVVPFEMIPADDTEANTLKAIKLYLVVPEKGGGYLSLIGAGKGFDAHEESRVRFNAFFNLEEDPGKWQHVAILVGGMTMRFYLNGRRTGDYFFDRAFPYVFNPAQYRIYLGMSPWRGGSCHFTGELTNPHIVERLLSENEIRQAFLTPE